MKYGLLLLLGAGVLAAQEAQGDAAGSIDGHVLGSLDHLPARKALVTLTGSTSSGRGVRLTADTDAAGSFQFLNLPPGVYRLSASRTGYMTHAARGTVTLGPGDKRTDVDIAIAAAGVISGRVLEDGDASPEAQILIFKQVFREGRRGWERQNRTVQADESGAYRVTNLAPGSYLLQANQPRLPSDNRYGSSDAKTFEFYAPTYYPSAVLEKSASSIQIRPGSDLRGVDIRLYKVVRQPAKSYRVRGKLLGMPAGFSGQAAVDLSPSDPLSGVSNGGSARSPDWTFDIPARPGDYSVGARVVVGELRVFARVKLNVAADVSGLDLAMSPPFEISGRAKVLEEGAPVDLGKFRLQLRGEGIATFEVASDAAGQFTTSRLPPGSYSIQTIKGMPESCYLREVRWGGQAISGEEAFEVAAAGQLEFVLSRTAGFIAGTVVDDKEKPLPAAIVSLVATDGKSPPAKQVVDGQGAFRFSSVRPGTYKLFAWEEIDDDLWPDPEFWKRFEGVASEVTVSPSETANAQPRAILSEALFGK